MDVDIAEESTRLAKYQILVQASASMLAQANMMPNSAMMLLG
jgi:flagellin